MKRTTSRFIYFSKYERKIHRERGSELFSNFSFLSLSLFLSVGVPLGDRN